MTIRVKFGEFYLVNKIPFTSVHYFHRSEIQANMKFLACWNIFPHFS